MAGPAHALSCSRVTRSVGDTAVMVCKPAAQQGRALLATAQAGKKRV